MYVQTVMLMSFRSCNRTSIQLLCSGVRRTQLLGIATMFMAAGDVAFLLSYFFGDLGETSTHY